jgi:hypothetical protein
MPTAQQKHQIELRKAREGVEEDEADAWSESVTEEKKLRRTTPSSKMRKTPQKKRET